MTLLESAETGDQLKALRSLRDILAREIDACDSLRDLASLSARFESVVAKIAGLAADSEKKGDPIDEIAARRTARGGATARTNRTEGVSS